MNKMIHKTLGECINAADARKMLGGITRQALASALGKTKRETAPRMRSVEQWGLTWIPLADIRKYKREIAGKPGRKTLKSATAAD